MSQGRSQSHNSALRAPAPPTGQKAPARDPNLVAKMANEQFGGSNPLLGRLYSSTAPGAGGVPNVLSTAAKKPDSAPETPVDATTPAPPHAASVGRPGDDGSRAKASSLALFSPAKYSNNDVRTMLQRGAQPAASQATVVRRRQTPPARLVPLSSETALVESGPGAAAAPAAAGHPDDEEPEAAALSVVSRFRKTTVNTPKEFTYLTMRPRGIRDMYNPYDLVVVSHKEVNAQHYFTVSTAGVTKFDDGESEFIDLKAWEREHRIFHKLVKLDVFKLYKTWKGFGVWRKLVRRTSTQTYKTHLDDNLFKLHRDLANPLRRVRDICLEFQNTPIYLATAETKTLNDFVRAQKTQLESVRRKLDKTIRDIRDILESACKEAMQTSDAAREREMQQGTNLLDDPTKRRTVKRGLQLEAGAADQSREQEGKMSYIEISQKRAVCRRLTSYIRLCDYMVINALCTLAMKAMRDAHTDLQFPRQHQPPPPAQEDAKDKRHHHKHGKKVEEEKGPFTGMIFVVDILYNEENPAIVIAPSMTSFTQSVDELLRDYVKMVSNVQRLAQMDTFKVYTKHAILEHGGDAEFGFGPDVGDMVTSEDEYKSLTQGVRTSLTKAFQSVEQYAARFDEFKDMYVENSKLNPQRLKRIDPPLDEFRDMLIKYRKQGDDIGHIAVSSNVGLFQVKTDRLKEFFEPSPKECTKALSELLPIIASEKNAAMLDDLQACNRYLEAKPTTVEGYVEYTEYFQKLEGRQDDITRDFENLKELFTLLAMERIPVPEADDQTWRTGTRKEFDKLRQNMQQVEEEKDFQVRNFSRNIEEQLDGLKSDVADIVAAGKHAMIEDENGDVETVIEYVRDLNQRTERILKRERELNKFQELFGNDATPIPDLREEVAKDINDKVRLWTSMRDWQALVEEYSDKPFKKLDPAELNEQINKYTTIVKQVSRTQKSNLVVPKLKSMVEEWRQLYPIVQALKNDKIKEHHKRLLDDAIGKLQDPKSGAEKYLSEIPDYTLGMLIHNNVRLMRDEIMTISVTATEEDKLDQSLQKIQAIWVGGGGLNKPPVEFGITQHKDQKETYVLAGSSVEDIAAQLEDSLLVVSMISASKYCTGSLKTSVDRWESDLRSTQDSLDRWLELQRNWMYLETIFSSSEIRKQWKNDAIKFDKVDKKFRELMRRVHDLPSVHASLMLQSRNLGTQFEHDNKILEAVLTSLEIRLDERRRAFPRFYFLSNDDLLDVLAKTNTPDLMMQHMLKMFDGIKSVTLTSNKEMTHINSMEGEKVELSTKSDKARGDVDVWLNKLEANMFVTLRRLVKIAVEDFETRGERTAWIFQHPVQLVLIASQMFWSRGVENALESGDDVPLRMKEQQEQNYAQLEDLAGLTGRKLSRVQRGVLSTLITIDVHGRDLVDEMVENGVSSSSDFGWTKQLRVNWEADTDGHGNMFIRQNNSRFRYGYEYLGAQGRLVITPLTDRVYMTITGALKLYLGAAPAGPAGTGKTETTKDLAKNLARQCIVYNCSDGVTYKMMEKFFLGLIQTGAWTCLDEFNRINIEVLSVIAAQLLEIKLALQSHQEIFTFQGIPKVPIRETYGVFITMNPGYAGRTELPDNLKILFRPVAVMTPDFRMIAEVILYSEGFKNAKDLSLKITQLYKLSSEQLSPQNHYDFGMRALKSILVMAGDLKRSQPGVEEDLTLIVACNDSNIPKFVSEDVPLFNGIMADLFPGAKFPERSYPELLPAMEKFMEKHALSNVSTWVSKGIQYYETLIVRHGVMLVGESGTGKTESRECIAFALDEMARNGSAEKMARPVHQFIINPKSIFMHELYGMLDVNTNEWRDGHLAVIAKNCVKAAEESNDHSWIVFDGPVDTLWIESMNSVLDDSKLLCLDNGDRLKFPETMHLLFEVADLTQASPATVSRCGMVYVDGVDLPWTALVEKWSRTKLIDAGVQQCSREYIVGLFNEYLPKGFEWLQQNRSAVMIDGGVKNVAQSCCDLFTAVMRADKLKLTEDPKDGVVLPPEDSYWKERNEMATMLFAFCFAWSIGANVDSAAQEAFDAWQRDTMEHVPFPNHGAVFDFYPDFGAKKFLSWETKMQPYEFNSSTAFFDILVPTIDTVRYAHIAKTLIGFQKPLLFTGHTGVGKSVILADMLTANKNEMGLVVINFQFSAQTSSPRTQELIESKLKSKRKNMLGAPPEKHVVLFIDDLNMPALEQFGASPPVELLRQMMGNGGFYDRKMAGFWKFVQDVTVISACGPPEGGRNPVTQRLTRMFHIMQIPNLSEDSIKKIFVSILQGFFNEKKFHADVRNMAGDMISGSVEIFQRIREDLRPRPSTPHYTFNLRDIAKVCQGLMQVIPRVCNNPQAAARLWIHENMRCFYDRLVSQEDRQYFTETLMIDIVKRLFPSGNWNHADTFEGKPIVWGDFLRPGAAPEDKSYEEVDDFNKLAHLFDEYLEDYNAAATAVKDGDSQQTSSMNLVFFRDHCEHLARIIRIIRQPRGNALLVGVGGSGKQSLTRLATSIAEYKRFEIAVAKGYSMNDFHEKLLELYSVAGVKCTPLVFLVNDSQIVHEGMLEDLNNILNSGEVPSLFSPDERDKKINQCTEAAREAGVSSRDEIWSYFISRVRDNFHVALCMSPVGDAFRTRCRQFPSLTNVCAIDWFNEWPREALHGVAERLMSEVELGQQTELRQPLTDLCVEIHTTVQQTASEFWEEMRRRYYITPTSYLEFISLYRSLLDEKTAELNDQLDRLQNGKLKMKETNETIAVMKVQLEEKQPLLEKAQKDNEVLVADLKVRKEKAAVVQVSVAAQQAEAAVQQKASKELEEDASAQLAEALPAVEAAIKALDSIDKSDLTELKSLPKPNEIVTKTMQAVMIFFEHIKPEVDGWSGSMDWKGAREFLGFTRLLDKLKAYHESGNLRANVIAKARKLIEEEPVLTPDVCGTRGSKACKGICLWILAMIKYFEVAKVVEPKKQALAAAREELAITNKRLAEAEAALKEVEDELATLQQGLEESTRRKELLENEVAMCRQRLINAESLSGSLKNEAVRWEDNIQRLEERLKILPVEMFLSAACVSYYGAFTARFRKRLNAKWIEATRAKDLPVMEDFSLVSALGDPVEILNWQICSLPTDETSTENAIIVTMSNPPRRWPLLIDPQGQANKWITLRAKQERPMKVVKLTEGNYMRTIDMSIRAGTTILCDDVGEVLDPALDPLLMRQMYYVEGTGWQINLTPTSQVPYERSFRFFISTKLTNPHYLPDVCIKVAIVNFTVTMDGLEDQMLGEVVAIEQRELEEEKNTIILQISEGQKSLKKTEESILEKLRNAKGNILDDDILISDLKNAQSRAQSVAKRQEEAKEKIAIINKTRELYRPVANRCSILFFVLTDLANIDPMYQNSLDFFKRLVATVVETTTKPEGFDPKNPLPELFDEHLSNLMERITEATYVQVCRGLFNKDKMILSLLMCTSISRTAGHILEGEWQFFIRATAFIASELPPIPDELSWVSTLQWGLIEALGRTVPAFKGLLDDVRARPALWKQWVQAGEPHTTVLPGGGSANEDADGKDWENALNVFQKILLIRAWREEKLLFALTEYVKTQMGKKYTVAPPFNLQRALDDSTPATPIIFILSQGADPMNLLQNFAGTHGKKLQTVSLGQGQGDNAKRTIEACRKSGEWAMLQNCHLSKTFMPELENQVQQLQAQQQQLPTSFRLWLTSMPSSFFPVYVLQLSVKLTNEPPTGLRANMIRCYNEISSEELEIFEPSETFPGCTKEHAYKKLVYALCFFHSVMLERKKFGPLGWNVLYEWNDTDFHVSKQWLQLFLKEQAQVPWESLEYIIGQINYGGRVTDPQDRVTLMIVLQNYLTTSVLDDGCKFAAADEYTVPERGDIEHYRNCIDRLSTIDTPDVFGMHENASLRYQLQQSEVLMSTILSVQPRLVGSKGGGPTPDEQVMAKCEEFLSVLPAVLTRAEAGPTTFTTLASGLPNSMSTVLSHELVKYNELLARMSWSLEEMKKALRGLTVLSEDLDKMFASFLNDQVPMLWSAVGYASLKPLGAWFKDLVRRVAFIREWVQKGEPKLFWIGGFFNASAFMTGTLQAFARQHGDSVDKLGFSFSVLDASIEDITVGPESGAYVSGVFSDAWRWDADAKVMADSLPGEPYAEVPVLHFLPEVYHKTPSNFHRIPMYRTTIRKGNISSLGASSNYVLSIEAATEKPRSYWTLKGAACVCALNN